MGKADIVVLGLGNPIMSDDAVGLRVVDELERLMCANPVPGVELLNSTRAGFELIDLLTGFEHALLVDSLVLPEPVPGNIRRLKLEDVAGSVRLNSVHEINVATAFKLAEKLKIPMPRELEIYAVEADDVYTISEEMTPAVEKAVGPLALRLMARVMEIRETNRPVDSNQENSGSDERIPPISRSFYPPDES
jgi:hydrogenase maturation protease